MTCLLVCWEPDCDSPAATTCQSLPLPGIAEGTQRLAHKLCKLVASPRGQQQGCGYAGTAKQPESLGLEESKAGEVRATIPRSPWDGATGPGLPQPVMEWGSWASITYLCIYPGHLFPSSLRCGGLSCCFRSCVDFGVQFLAGES